MYIVYLCKQLDDSSWDRIAVGQTENPLYFRLTVDIYDEVQQVWPHHSGPVKIVYEKVKYESTND